MKELSFGQLITLERKKKGLTQTEAAKICGISKSILSLVEKGYTVNPSARVLLGIKRLYNLDANNMLDLLDKNMLNNFIVIGEAQHGKDSACELMRDHFGHTFESSSKFALKTFLYKELQRLTDNKYKNIDHAYSDRMNHRQFWHEAIKRYNTPDKAKLAKKLFLTNDIYCGMRCKEELNECRRIKLCKAVIWVDASQRKEPEPKTSNSITIEMADFVLCNNGSENDLLPNLRTLYNEKLKYL